VELILAENRDVLGQISAAALERFVSLLADVNRIFVVGEGRSGLTVRMFAMRLMHLGTACMSGETTTPALRRDDLLIACSGSGTTSGVLTRSQRNAG
jgi:6-phospho-3-hexuloisomerase